MHFKLHKQLNEVKFHGLTQGLKYGLTLSFLWHLWLPMDPVGFLLLPMTPYGTLYRPMAPYGSLWLCMAP